jgi:hypothetical protein
MVCLTRIREQILKDTGCRVAPPARRRPAAPVVVPCLGIEDELRDACAANTAVMQEHLGRFRQIGQRLLEAHERLPDRRQWIAWVHRTVGLRVQEAALFMEFATLTAKHEARRAG